MRIALLTASVLGLLSACATTQQPSGASLSSGTSTLSIFANQEVFVEVTVQKDASVVLAKVSKVTNPSTTVTFNFGKDDDGMMLSVKNPTDTSLKFHIDMVDFKGKLHPTSSCPVMAGLSAFEMWPHPIPEIRITNVHVVGKNEEGLCIY